MVSKKVQAAVAVMCIAAIFPCMDMRASPMTNYPVAEEQRLPGGEYPPKVRQELKHNDTYRNLYNVLKPHVKDIKHLLTHTTDQATYEVLYNQCESLAHKVLGGRVVVCLADGTVVVDTDQSTDFTNNNSGYANSYQHFRDKNVNENQNSRICIRNAQTYPAGVGVESNPGNTGSALEEFTALRLGEYLDNKGTVMISTGQLS